jgi:hypothetical protein
VATGVAYDAWHESSLYAPVVTAIMGLPDDSLSALATAAGAPAVRQASPRLSGWLRLLAGTEADSRAGAEGRIFYPILRPHLWPDREVGEALAASLLLLDAAEAGVQRVAGLVGRALADHAAARLRARGVTT